MGEKMYQFRVEQLRTFSYPDGSKRIVVEMPIKELPTDLPMDVNARVQNLQSGVSRAIKRSLNDPERSRIFHIINRGIVITVHKAIFNKDSGLLTIILKDREQHGVLDGGHTYKLVTRHATANPDTEVRVYLEVLVGVEDYLVDIVGSRNSSVQVDAPSLLNVEGRFDPILAHLSKKGLTEDMIRVRQNDDKEIDIQDILGIMYLFDVDSFRNDLDGFTKPPILSYTGKGSVINHFRRYELVFSQKMLPLVPDILYLWDYVALRALEHYRQGTGREAGRIGGLKFVEKLPEPNPGLFMPSVQVEYNLPKAYRLPLIAALRGFVDDSGPAYSWRKLKLPPVPPEVEVALGRKATPVERLYEYVAPALHKHLWQKVDSVGGNPMLVGRDPLVWNMLYGTAWGTMNQLKSL